MVETKVIKTCFKQEYEEEIDTYLSKGFEIKKEAVVQGTIREDNQPKKVAVFAAILRKE